jgi:transcriptional regulator with XRE-family HTH domain
MSRLFVASNIRERLDEKNIAVQAFERKAGLNLNAVQNILSGRSQNPGISTLISIANAFDCTVDELLGGKNGKENKEEQEAKKIMFSNRMLLTEIFGYLKDNLVSEDAERSSLDVYEAIQEIYLFSEKNNKGSMDERFAKWWLERAKLN